MAKPNVKQPDVKGSKQTHGRFDFVKLAPLMGGLSLLAMIVAVVLILSKGFVYGIDFAGGTEMQVKFNQAVSVADLRTLVEQEGVKEPSVQSLGDQNEFLIRLPNVTAATEKEVNDITRNNVNKIQVALTAKMGLPADGVRRIDTVGPSIGSELKRNSLLAAFYSFLLILIYVALRFDYKYAPGAVICLIHDALLTLAVFVLLGKEVNVQIMAAILTLIGYSINDTIVTFDRIRETLPQFREQGLKFVINRAINDVLGRTILTASMTLIAVAALAIFGSGVIRDIAFTLVIGVIVGCYSSIYVAAPMILVMDKFKRKA